MSTKFTDLLILKEGLGDRLKAARIALGLLQGDVAALGHVSRATQVSYEAGTTEPSVSYLRAIQGSGIDMPYILFDRSSLEFDLADVRPGEVDWARLMNAFEEVEFFCLRKMPACPSRYRWLMVAKLYTSPLAISSVGSPGDRSAADFLATVLDSLSPDTSALQGKPKG